MKKMFFLVVLTILGFSTTQAQMLQFGVKGGVNLPTTREVMLLIMTLKLLPTTMLDL